MQRVTVFGLLLPFSALLTLGCDLPPAPVGEDTETSTSGSTSAGPGGSGQVSTSSTGGPPPVGSSGTPLDMGGSTGETDPGASSSDSGPGASGGPLLDIGGGAGVSCDPLLQDCFAGEACYPENDAFECGGPTGPGQGDDPCAVDEECQAGLFCATDGVCREFCDINDGSSCGFDLTCEPWFPAGTAPPGLEDVGFCDDAPPPPPPGPECDPLLQDCPAGEGCYPNPLGSNFQCGPAGAAQAGDACGAGSCDIGLLCDAGTCRQLCETTVPSCIPGELCVDFYAPGAAPPGLETVGLCEP